MNNRMSFFFIMLFSLDVVSCQKKKDLCFSNKIIRTAIDDAASYDPLDYGVRSEIYRKNMRTWWAIKSVKKYIQSKGLNYKEQSLVASMNIIIKENMLHEKDKRKILKLMAIAQTAEQKSIAILEDATIAQANYKKMQAACRKRVLNKYFYPRETESKLL